MATWLQWLYQYGIGGLFFGATLVVALHSGAVRWSRGRDRRLVLALIAALFAFMSVHAAWIVLAAR